MLNAVAAFVGQYQMLQPGETVVCAVSGGADSVALLFALYLLKEKLGIRLEAVHFNHHLRAEESDRDEAFVKALCDRYDIPLHVGSGEVQAGKKGLEAAARDARYGFFATLDGKIATAHTADDNAETILMHLVRGTGLKGLGGIAPIRGNLIRPMLTVTRQENEAFLSEWCLTHMEDSSNEDDAFLRNRLRHHVMPLLKAENPKLAENLSQMALRLRLDEAYLASQVGEFPDVEALKAMHPAIRSRHLETFLKENGVKEPEDRHIQAVENLLYASNPSARVNLPGATIARNYDHLEVVKQSRIPEDVILSCPGEADFGNFHVSCFPATEIIHTPDTFTVIPQGDIIVSSRRAGDEMKLSGGTKSLKKLFIDRKIPASQRPLLPVLRDEKGVLGVCKIGISLDRAALSLPAVTIKIKETKYA